MKFISEVRVGDRILASDALGQTSYSDVVFVPHSANTYSTVFKHITTVKGRDLKMTRNHVLPAGVCGGGLSTSSLPLIYASQGKATTTTQEYNDYLQY